MCQENVCLWNCGYTDSYITQETILDEIKLLYGVNLHMCHVQISYSFLSICIQDNGGSDKLVREGYREFIQFFQLGKSLWDSLEYVLNSTKLPRN